MEKPFNARNNHKESVHKERTLLAPGLKEKKSFRSGKGLKYSHSKNTGPTLRSHLIWGGPQTQNSPVFSVLILHIHNNAKKAHRVLFEMCFKKKN
jgi:hypothetical protein